jgi:hypothetical protein
LRSRWQAAQPLFGLSFKIGGLGIEIGILSIKCCNNGTLFYVPWLPYSLVKCECCTYSLLGPRYVEGNKCYIYVVDFLVLKILRKVYYSKQVVNLRKKVDQKWGSVGSRNLQHGNT